MGHVYWEKHEIPIPKFGYINKNDGRVFMMEGTKRTVLGHAASLTTMHPNDTFRWLFPELWEEAYGTKSTLPHEVFAGMYALILGASYRTGIYPILQSVYGPQYGNAVLDYAMYSMMDRTSTTQLYPERMREQVIFSREVYSDSWFSDLFEHKLSKEKHHEYKVEWIRECQKRGITQAWISIDGSNNDCRATKSVLADFGKPKSHNHCTIVSYIYAVETEYGMPLTYFVNEGGVVDSKAFQEVMTFLDGYGIKVKGVILDRGFCTHDVIETIRVMEMDYILMTPGDNYGHSQVYKECSESIRWDPEHLVSDGGVFGTSHVEKLFSQHPETAVMNLFFDGAAGSSKSIQLSRSIIAEKKRLEAQIASGATPVVEAGFKKYLRIVKDDENCQLACEYKQWKSSMQAKGFFSIASSRDFGAEKVLKLYGLRDASETQYMILKSQEGFDTTRVHLTPGIYSKFHECFVASCLRADINYICRQLGLNTNVMIRKMNQIKFLLAQGGIYSFVKSVSVDNVSLLNAYSIRTKDFETFARYYNERKNSAISSQVHVLPEHALKEKKHRGRPVGSKNKKTLEREAMEADSETQKEPKKRGRPAGSKDKVPRKKRGSKKASE